MEPTTAQEYRKGKTKDIKLSSGYVFRIRKMTLPVMSRLLEILEIKLPKGIPLKQAEKMLREKVDNPEFRQKIVEAAIYTVPRVVISPRIVESDNPREDLSIHEIDPGDLFEIFMEAMDFSGLTGVAAKARRKFRR